MALGMNLVGCSKWNINYDVGPKIFEHLLNATSITVIALEQTNGKKNK